MISKKQSTHKQKPFQPSCNIDWKWGGGKVLLAVLFIALCVGALVVSTRIFTSTYGKTVIDEIILLVISLTGSFVGGRLDAINDEMKKNREVHCSERGDKHE